MTNAKKLKPYPYKVCEECFQEFTKCFSYSSAIDAEEGKCDVCGSMNLIYFTRDFGYPDFPGHEKYSNVHHCSEDCDHEWNTSKGGKNPPLKENCKHLESLTFAGYTGNGNEYSLFCSNCSAFIRMNSEEPERVTQTCNYLSFVIATTNKGRIFGKAEGSPWKLFPPIPFDQFPIDPSNPKEDE